MLASSRTVRLLAGLSIVAVAIPAGLSTPWVKGIVFERIAAAVRARYGLELRAERFDYRMMTLTASAAGASVLDPRAPDRPVIEADSVTVDLGRAILRGRLDVDSLRIGHLRVGLGARTLAALRDRPVAGNGDPPSIGRLEIDRLDLLIERDDGTRVSAESATVTLARREDGTLAGRIAVGAIAFGNDRAQVKFERAEAHVAVEDAARVVGAAEAVSEVGTVRIDGTIPFDRDGSAPVPAGALRHIGLYAYRAAFLRVYPTLERAPIETLESLEQLRALWHGYRIVVDVAAEQPPPGVDTPADLERVRRIVAGRTPRPGPN